MEKRSEESLELSPGAKWVVEATRQIFMREFSAWNYLGVNHWLLGLTELYGSMIEEMVEGIDVSSLRLELQKKIEEKNAGTQLPQDKVILKAGEVALSRGRSQVTEREMAVVILNAAGYLIREEKEENDEEFDDSEYISEEELERRFNEIIYMSYLKENSNDSGRDSDKNLDVLKKYGRDLTGAAQRGKLGKVVGREEEIQLVIETLCRRTKRNPVLVGPAGVGKTAIVEGLSQRVVAGKVPKELAGVRIFEIQPSILVAGSREDDGLEKIMKDLVNEASQEGVILFIDELHSIVGAGGMIGTTDIASMLKPALARGDVACIAATTEEEYRRFIEPNPALERRFQPIRVQEMSAEQTLVILSSVRDELEEIRGVHVPDHVLRWLVYFAQQFLRNRYFPDKAVDLLEQCVAHALTQEKRSVDQETAVVVAQRIVGMPMDLGERLNKLKKNLIERALLTEKDVSVLLNRLNVTMRGFDLRPSRPNAVLLLLGKAALNSIRLAETIAECVYGAAERTVSIDFSRMQHPSDVAMLVGAPPGYLGYNESLPLHRVLQMPYCVLQLENIHACHPAVREVVTKMLSEGALVDARGRRIFLSDTIILVTADVSREVQQIPGFKISDETSVTNLREEAEAELGKEFVSQIDLICMNVTSTTMAQRHWLQQNLLQDLSERFKKIGVSLSFDESLIDWLMSKNNCENQRDWERLIDDNIGSVLVRCLSSAASGEGKTVILRCNQGIIDAEIREKGAVRKI